MYNTGNVRKIPLKIVVYKSFIYKRVVPPPIDNGVVHRLVEMALRQPPP